MRKQHLITAFAVGLALIVTACSKSSTSTSSGQQPAEPAKPGPVTYTAHDFSFDGPATLPAGTSDITLQNEGAQKHQLIIVQLNKNQDWTVEEFATFVKEHPKANPSWAPPVGGAFKPIPNGETEPAQFADFSGGKPKPIKNGSLKPGTYLMMCFVTDPATKQPHAALGMIEKVTVA